MDSGIDDLSEKEREALRLLLAGHDAKSSARELGVTHHAINDRLRSARRKLGTSSSREAALALAEAEGTTPEPIVHKPLGDDKNAEDPDFSSSADRKRREEPRSPWRLEGWIIMSLLIITTAAVALAIVGSNGAETQGNTGQVEAATTTAPRADTDADTTTDAQGGRIVEVPVYVPAPSEGGAASAAHPVVALPPGSAKSEREARAFLQLLAQGDAKAAYATANAGLRQRYNFDLWELGVLMYRADGEVQKRTLIGVTRDDAPDTPGIEQLETLTFDTVMLDGDRKIEKLAMGRQDGGWSVVNIDSEKIED